MNSEKEYFDIYELLILLLENDLTDSQRNRLIEWSRTDPNAVNTYHDFLRDYSILSSELSGRVEIEYGTSEDTQFDQTLWCALLEQEKMAPGIEIPHEQPERKLIQNVVYPPRKKRTISKFNIFLFNTAAAILFLVILKSFYTTEGVEVATLSDSINAKWADVAGSMETGNRLVTHREFYLKEGLAELLFDNNVKVVIEGPAEFELLGEDRIRLNFGSLYSSVPPEAVGFSIFTQNVKIFDLGTEFGVEADYRGNTLLHVIKGSTMLIAGDLPEKKSVTVNQGAAKRISADTCEISDISCDYDYFARNINSKGGLVWRGGNLSLAGIAAGGDGFQKIGSLTSLDPVKGEYVKSIKDVYVETNNAYNLVPDIKQIDGVFVPDGEFGPVQITSSGLTFDCPDTSGVFTHEIVAYKGPIKNQHTTIPPVIIDGQELVNEPILMLHSNIGMTFDLQAIRNAWPQLNLKSLKATGIPITGSTFPEFKFWVLVDGHIEYERDIAGGVGRDPLSFDVEFGPQDRFLTLIVTDGLGTTDGKEGKKSPNVPSYASDFFYLINPELCLTGSL